MSKKTFEKGRRWGFAIFKKNYEILGERGIRVSHKAGITCNKIACSEKRNGKKLDKNDVDFYKGATNGFLEFYNKKIRDVDSEE